MASSVRVRVDGKFFRLGKRKFHAKGVTYGPFAQNEAGEPFATKDETARDFDLITRLGANLLRIYEIPPPWFLSLAERYGFKLLIDLPWAKHLCFADSGDERSRALKLASNTARFCSGHPSVFGFNVVNEIPPDIVRWTGAEATSDFIDELIAVIKERDHEALCSFGTFPPTEFLRPQLADFLCVNIYLHQQAALDSYLSRLQMIADSKPLLLGEVGLDSLREGEARKCEILSWTIETAFRRGLAGSVIYSFTDDWHTGGFPVEGWEMGLTTKAREPKESFHVVERLYRIAPYFPLRRYPFVSVVVASYNGAKTLPLCLESLGKLNYPSYEVILVDDGSTDDTRKIAANHAYVRMVRHEENRGLSAARNSGIKAARGEVIAFTDADCRADEDWLHYLIGDLVDSSFAGVGGHNLLPPEDSWVAAAVMVSPGGPAHVMITDRVAEHIPGCNMAFYKWALAEVEGFDPLFTKAGDDVDICWRLQQRGFQIGFSPAGFVWHYRRSTLAAYLRQQVGYGEAEALLVYRHPEYFTWYGASQWQGKIYSPAKFGVVAKRPVIYHGAFGSAFFQTLYASPPASSFFFVTSIEYHVLVTLPLFLLSLIAPSLLPLGVASLLISVLVCVAATAQADLPRNKSHFWSGPLITLLFLLQPIVRGWARYKGRLTTRKHPLSGFESLETLSLEDKKKRFDQAAYWTDTACDRITFLKTALRELDKRGWQNKADAGWNEYDIEIYGSRWTYLRLITACEHLNQKERVIRCRLEPSWTFLARFIFSAVCGGLLLIIGALGHVFPWLWLLLLTLPAFDWWIAKEQRDLQRLISAFLDDIAKSLELQKLDESKGSSGSPA